MADSLGAAVLTLTTDSTQFFSGLDQAEKKTDGLRKALDTTGKTAKGAGTDMADLGKNMSGTGSLADDIKGRFLRMGPAIVGAFSIGAITAAIKSYSDFTGNITDLSAKTGIGTEALQRLKYAAEQNGTSLETVTDRIIKLGINLAGGKDSTVGALKALGLSFDEIRSMSPDQAFATIGEAIKKIPDSAAGARIGTELMGKGVDDVLAMMRSNLTDTMNAADKLGIVMSDDAVKAGDEFGDTMSSLISVGQAVIGQVLTPMIPALTTAALWLGENIPKAVSGARGAFDWLIKKGLEIKLSFEEFVLGMVELGGKVPWLGEKLGATSERIQQMRQSVQMSKDTIAAFDAQTRTTSSTVTAAAGTMSTLKLNYDETAKAAKEAAQSAKEKAAALDTIRSASVALTPAQQASVREWQNLNISANDMAKALGVNVIQVDRFIGSLQVLRKEIPTLGIDDIAKSLSGDHSVAAAARDATDQIERMKIGFGLVREKVTELRDANLSDFGDEVDEIPPKISRVQQTMDQLATNVSTNLSAMLLGTQSFRDGWSNIWGSMKDMAVGHLSQMLDGFLKNFIGGMLNGLTGSKGSFTQAFSGATSGFGGVLKSLTGSVAGAVTGWVGIATAAFAGIKSLWDSGIGRGGEEGVVVNPARDKWFGGREVQHIGDQLAEKGIDGEQARQMIERVFKASKKTEFESATEAIDRILKGIPAMAEGGIVMRPTFSLIGERGPEAVIPLHGLTGRNREAILPQIYGRNAQAESNEQLASFDRRLASMEAMQKHLPRAISVAVRDAVLQAL